MSKILCYRLVLMNASELTTARIPTHTYNTRTNARTNEHTHAQTYADSRANGQTRGYFVLLSIMQSLKDRLKENVERLRGLGAPPDAAERHVVEVVERATSEMMINPDWGINMEAVDIINTNSTPACYERVFKALRRRLMKSNPKIQVLTLTLLETCVKNTGSEFQTALAASDFWEEVLRLADPKKRADLQVQDKVLILVEDCAHALPTSRFRDSYNALQMSGVRFPTRQPEEIGAGFSLPPSTRDATAMADVSAEDQRAIQEALQDLSREPAPPPVQQRVPFRPQMEEPGRNPEQLHSDLRFVANSVELLKDALGSIPLNEPEMVHQDYIKDLCEQCTETLPKLKKLIEGATNENVLAEALALNDELGAVLLRYEEMVKKAANAKKPVEEVEETSLMAFDGDVTAAAPGEATGGGASTSSLPPRPPPPVDDFATLATESATTQTKETDPFDMLAAQTSQPVHSSSTPQVQPPPPPPPQPNAKKSDDPFDDLITL